MLSIVAGILWGIVLVVGGYWVSRVSLIAVFIANTLLLFGVAGSSNLFFWAIYGIPSLIMGLLLTRQKGYYELQKWGMTAAALVVCFYMGVLYSPFGSPILSRVQTQISDQIEQSRSLQDPAFIEIYGQQGITADELKEDAYLVSVWLTKHLPSMYLVQILIVMQIILSFTSYWLHKKGVHVLQHRPFKEEIMPWPLAWVVILGLVLWLWGRNELTIIYYTGSNILLGAGAIATYYGISNISFWWNKLPMATRRLVLPLLFVSTILLFVPVMFFVALLGLFDSLFDYRNLYPKKEASQ
jgi:hypothetical protein